jgi:hypothetical protein
MTRVSLFAFPRWLFVLAAVALSLLIAWAAGVGGPIIAAMARVAAEPWGWVLLADLYSGFLAATALFVLFERRWVACGLFIALMVLGNIVTLAWLGFRGWSLLAVRRT